MDNTSLPHHNGALSASSHALEQSIPLPSPNNTYPLKPVSKALPPVGTLLSDIQGKAVRWLWQRRLPLGKLTTLDGDLCLGKSTLALDIAARVSSGQDMPDGTPGIAGGAGVVLIAPDDGLADTILPRLQSAGADLSRIISIGTIPVTDSRTGHTYQRPFRLPDDLGVLMEAIGRVRARLVLIDPLISMFDPKKASKDAEVRAALAPLQMLIEYAEVACLVVGHLTKGGGSLSPLGGSAACVSAASSGLIVLQDPTDERKRVLASVKSKLSAQATSLSFCIVSDSDEDAGGGRPLTHWLGECSLTLQELLNPPASVAIQPLGTVRQEILEVLEMFHPEALSVKALAEVLPEISNSNLRKTLKRMVADGQIQQFARGAYGAFSAPSPSPEQQDQSQQEQSSQESQSSQPIEADEDLSQQEQSSQSISTDENLSQQEQSSQESQESQPIEADEDLSQREQSSQDSQNL